MTPHPRREAALKLLAATGLSRLNYEPPLVRMLWRMGFDIPPPHFATFSQAAWLSGVSFAGLWGLLMWVMVGQPNGLAMPWGIGIAGFVGLLFGVAMASYYAWGRRRHKLPDWQSLPDAAAPGAAG